MAPILGSGASLFNGPVAPHLTGFPDCFGLGALAWAAAERGETERAGVLWAAIEAEEARAPNPMWAIYRDRFAAHIPEEPRPSSPLGVDEAAEYALSDG